MTKEAHRIVLQGTRDLRAAYAAAFTPLPSVAQQHQQVAPSRPFMWRLDRQEFSSTLKIQKDNIVRLALGPTITWPGDDDDESDTASDAAAGGAGGEAELDVVMVTSNATTSAASAATSAVAATSAPSTTVAAGAATSSTTTTSTLSSAAAYAGSYFMDDDDDDAAFAEVDWAAFEGGGSSSSNTTTTHMVNAAIATIKPPPAVLPAPVTAGGSTSPSNSSSSSTGSSVDAAGEQLTTKKKKEVVGISAPVGRGDVKRQRLIVDLAAPRFRSNPLLPWTGDDATSSDVSDSRSLTDGISFRPRVLPRSSEAQLLKREFFSSLNDDQRRAVLHALSARDYACLLGMPGTGKTSTIAYLVRCLVALGFSVVITSHTHSAVDTLLLKLVEVGLGRDLLRLGKTARVHPGVRHRCLDAMIEEGQLASVASVSEELSSAPIIGTTCLGIKHAVFSRRKFDVCIVDEASQIPEPIALGPLRTARRFILVGDHNQLPPLVKSRQAKAGGMDVSLFKRLCDAHPGSVAPLGIQYRMNEDIQSISNALVYAGALRCGSAAVAQSRYALPSLHALPAPATGAASITPSAAAAAGSVPHWLTSALAPSTTVAFLDTDGLQPVTLKRLGSPSASSNGTTDVTACGLEVRGRSGGSTDAGSGNPAGPTSPSAAAVGAPVAFFAPSSTSNNSRNRHKAAEVGAMDEDAGGSDGISSSPTSVGGSGAVLNPTEVALVSTLVMGILLSGGKASDIGIICPFRSQLRLLREVVQASVAGLNAWALANRAAFADAAQSSTTTSSSSSPSSSSSASGGLPVPAAGWRAADIEIETVDRYQGRDKPVIIMSLVRSNPEGSVGQLLQDLRRLNVAVTRAKSKLLLVGSRSTAVRSGCGMLVQLVEHLEHRRWVLGLPRDAARCYPSPLDAPRRVMEEEGYVPPDGNGAVSAAAQQQQPFTTMATTIIHRHNSSANHRPAARQMAGPAALSAAGTSNVNSNNNYRGEGSVSAGAGLLTSVRPSHDSDRIHAPAGAALAAGAPSGSPLDDPEMDNLLANADF